MVWHEEIVNEDKRFFSNDSNARIGYMRGLVCGPHNQQKIARFKS